ncbi:hypothetical protein [Streptomyces sp. KR80]|uniref:hypothetical protein n=1 Tax=Streptomyces sp. KR80 TaxID=3457426 RepID=UPI003FD5AC98
MIYLGKAIALALYLQAFITIPGFVLAARLLGYGALDAARDAGKAVEMAWDKLYPPTGEDREADR